MTPPRAYTERLNLMQGSPSQSETPVLGRPHHSVEERGPCVDELAVRRSTRQGITQDVTIEAMSVILTSADGVVMERSASEGVFMTALDSVSLAPTTATPRNSQILTGSAPRSRPGGPRSFVAASISSGRWESLPVRERQSVTR